MSKLSAFLNPVSVVEEKEVIISNRFLDEGGEPVPFKIRSLTQEENEALVKKSQEIKKVNGQTQKQMDNTKYSRLLVMAATVEPDFSQKEICDKYGVLDPALVPGKMLLAGEYAKLVEEITRLSGFEEDQIGEEAKN